MSEVAKAPASAVVLWTSFSQPSAFWPAGSVLNGEAKISLGSGGHADVAPVQRDHAAVETFFADGAHIALGRAHHIRQGEAAEIIREIVAHTGLADQGAIGGGKTVRDKAVILQRIDKALEANAVAIVQAARQFGKAGMGDGVGEIHAGIDIDGAAIR